MDRLKTIWGKYRYVLLVALTGLALMLMPGSPAEQTAPLPTQPEKDGLESRLEEILSRIDGAGQVAVLLTEEQGGETFYQTQGEDGKTVLVTGSDRSESGLVRTTRAPAYRGAVVVCQGANNSIVQLAVVEAVANATGLGTDRITVLNMK